MEKHFLHKQNAILVDDHFPQFHKLLDAMVQKRLYHIENTVFSIAQYVHVLLYGTIMTTVRNRLFIRPGSPNKTRSLTILHALAIGHHEPSWQTMSEEGGPSLSMERQSTTQALSVALDSHTAGAMPHHQQPAQTSSKETKTETN